MITREAGQGGLSAERLLLLVGVVVAAVPLLVLVGLLGGAVLLALRPDAVPTAAPAAFGASAAMTALAVLLALPIGVGTAVYLEEYAQEGQLTTLLETNIALLTGIPSALYGFVGAAVFVWIHSGSSSGAGATGGGAALLALVCVPLVTDAARRALRGVPDGLREGALALGATRLRVLTAVVLPIALPHILSGTLRAAAAALGEAAPLLLLAGVLHPVWGTLPLPVLLFAQADATSPAPARIALLLLAAVVLLHGAAWGVERLSVRAAGAT